MRWISPEDWNNQVMLPGEPLDFRPSHDALPTFRLKVNRVESQAVFLDDPVDALIAALPDRLTRILPTTVVSHLDQDVHHETLEELS